MAGEYGEKSGREHFHVLIYNHHYDLELVQEKWGLGFVYDGTLSQKSIKYVAGYVSKKGYDPESGKRPPYGRMSCNLPDNLSFEEITDMCVYGRVKYNGHDRKVPATWKYRYKEMWDFYKKEREEYRYQQFLEQGEKKQLTPDYVRGLMEHRELSRLIKKGRFKNGL